MFYIVISEKGGPERREVFDGTSITVGRVQDNDLTLAKGNVSKRHCRIDFSDGRFVVTDEDSTNGTYVNRRRIAAPTIVREGDRVYVGDFVLRMEGPAAAENTDKSSQPGASPPAAPQFVLPLGAERSIERDVEPLDPGRATATNDSIRAPAPPAVARSTRRVEQTSAFPVVTGDLFAAAPGSGAAAERAAARTLIDEVWRRLESRALERMLDGETHDRVTRILSEQVQHLPSLGHALSSTGLDQALALARSELLGLGPLDTLLDDVRVTEILVFGARRLQIVRDGSSQAVASFCHPESPDWALARLCRQANTEILEHEMLVRRWLTHNGLRLDAARGQVSSGGALICIRRTEIGLTELDELVHVGTLSRTMATFLRHCCMARLNILVAGRPHSGCNELAAALAALSSSALTWLCWSSESLRPPPTIDCHRVHLTPDVDLGETLNLLLQMGQRVVAPNPPRSAMPALVNAAMNGLDGLVVCQDAPSIEAALQQWATAVATREGGTADAHRQLRGTFDVAIEAGRLSDGRSRVFRIAELPPRAGAPRDIFEFVVDRTATGGSIEGHFRGADKPPGVLATLRTRGLVVDESLFLRPPSD